MAGSVEAVDVEAAAIRISGQIMQTPCVTSQTLSAITGCTLHLKFENLQFTASFKERGALNKLLLLKDAGDCAGVCAMSAGNHAQGLAYHAKRLGIPATIVMPKGTPLTKISRTRDHGANVAIAGNNLSEALQIALLTAESERLAFVHPFDDPAVIAGQGTIAAEMLAAVPAIDTLVVPIGGGGLISGVAVAAKALKPDIRIVGVQSLTYPSMQRALQGEEAIIPDGMTIAEGIAVKTAGKLTREIVRKHVDEILLVEETSIERAVALLLSVEKTVVEGAGAVGLAAMLEHPAAFAGRTVGTILSGGNIDLRAIADVAMRELSRSGHLLRFDLPIADRPGALAEIGTVLGEVGANIFSIGHDRMSLTQNQRGAVLNVVAEVQDRGHGEAVLDALRQRAFAPAVRGL
ncbi:threonine dehydratase [Sphingobium sp. C100]|nr:threonine dehydratase [Sphingobium sp. C100]